jgi:putative ABC transport system permease protein
MFGHYLLTFYRALSHHRLYAALNALGLAIGIAVFLALWLDVRFETSFDRWIPHAGQVYLIHTSIDAQPDTPATGGAVLERLRTDYPGTLGTRVWPMEGYVRRGGRASPEQAWTVDPSFFQVLELPFVAGDPATALNRLDGLVLTQAMAHKYFGTDRVLGRTLAIDFGAEPRIFRISGVLRDLPLATSFRMELIVPLVRPGPGADHNWNRFTRTDLLTYLRFATPAEARALGAQLDAFADRHAGHEMAGPPHTWVKLRLEPQAAFHMSDPKLAAVVTALGAVGALTLLAAVLNYINLATARAGLRAREVALRRIMGATGPTLVVQFLAEACAFALLSTLLGLALCEAVLPAINAMAGVALRLDYVHDPLLLAVVAAVVVVVGLGGGAYPALVLARFRPAAVLASAKTPGGGRMGARLREALVAVQFVIAIAFTVATGVMFAQTDYVRHADLGFRREGLVVVSSFGSAHVSDAQRASLLAAWRGQPGVLDATQSMESPANGQSPYNRVTRAGDAGEGVVVHQAAIGRDFFQTYGVRLLAGRLPDPDHGDFAKAFWTWDHTAAGDLVRENVVLNARAVAALGFKDARAAVGQLITAHWSTGPHLYTVIGVVTDMRFGSPRDPIVATAFVPNEEVPSALAAIRFSGAEPKDVAARMQAVWRQVVPTEPFEWRTGEQALEDAFYVDDDRHARLFTFGAVLAVGVGCLGLYGLASFSAVRRTREIGIRKTLGASSADIMRLLVSQFLRPVLLANLVAWPLAWLAMRTWLGGFDQRIALGPQYFLSATVLTLAVALITVAGQAMYVARATPAKALRHE